MKRSSFQTWESKQAGKKEVQNTSAGNSAPGWVLFPILLFFLSQWGLKPGRRKTRSSRFGHRAGSGHRKNFYPNSRRLCLKILRFSKSVGHPGGHIDLPDGAGNVVKAGVAWADRIAAGFTPAQFDVVSAIG